MKINPDEAEKYIIEKSNSVITNYYLALLAVPAYQDRLLKFLSSAPP